MNKVLVAIVLVLLTAMSAAGAVPMPSKDVYPFQFFVEVCLPEEDGVSVYVIATDSEKTLGRVPYPSAGWFFYLDDQSTERERPFWVTIYNEDGDETKDRFFVDLDRDGLTDEVLTREQARAKYGINICTVAKLVRSRPRA